MSFFKDVGALYKRARGVIRSRFGGDNEIHKQIAETGHGVDLSKEDAVVVSLADERFKEIYPKPETMKLWNQVSILNVMASATSNLSFAASVVLATIFFGNAIGGASYLLNGDLTLVAYFTNFATQLAAAGSAFCLGSFMRKIDRDLTMKLCLDSAQRVVDANKELYYDKALQIEMDVVDSQKKADLLPLHEMKRSLKSDTDTLWHTINALEKETGGNSAFRLESINALRRERDNLLERYEAVNAHIAEIEKNAQAIAGNVRLKNILLRALPASTTIEALQTGALDSEITDLGESAKENLARLAEDTKTRREELIAKIGLSIPETPSLPSGEDQLLLEAGEVVKESKDDVFLITDEDNASGK